MSRFVLRGGDVVDGTGGAAYRCDVLVEDGLVRTLGEDLDVNGSDVVDIGGLALCPGFIDVHSHDDQALLHNPDMTPKTSQGVTTVITGNCGLSLAPLPPASDLPMPLSEIASVDPSLVFDSFAAYLQALEDAPAAVNAAALVGHIALRVAAMDDLQRPATLVERRRMRELCVEALDAGAVGFSSGLFYPPAAAAPADEVVELAVESGARGGVYTAHLRDEAAGVGAALEEAILTARRARVPLVVSHHKLTGRANHGRSVETLRQIAHASTDQQIGFDVYPYTANFTMLNSRDLAAAECVLVADSTPHPEQAGRDLRDIARDLGLSEAGALAKLSPGTAVYFTMSDDDVERILSSPQAMIGSDGVPTSDRCHPRLWGTFTRVLGPYVRDVGVFSFEEAVRRMTALSASRFRLGGRGVIAPGAHADLVAVDRATVGDRATYAEPTLPSHGVHTTWVAGVPVWHDGAATGERPGRVIRRR